MTARPLHEIVADIASKTIELGGREASRYLLYVEFLEGMIGPDLFQDVGTNLAWIDTDPLTDLLFEMNRLVDPHPIGAFTLDIVGKRFNAAFDYEVELLEGTDERLKVVVKSRFGDKPVIYPPMPAGAMELRPAK